MAFVLEAIKENLSMFTNITKETSKEDLINQAYKFYSQGNNKEAELSIRKAIELNPDFAKAHHNLGNTLKEHGKLQEAELSTCEKFI